MSNTGTGATVPTKMQLDDVDDAPTLRSAIPVDSVL